MKRAVVCRLGLHPWIIVWFKPDGGDGVEPLERVCRKCKRREGLNPYGYWQHNWHPPLRRPLMATRFRETAVAEHIHPNQPDAVLRQLIGNGWIEQHRGDDKVTLYHPDMPGHYRDVFLESVDNPYADLG